MVQRYRTVFTLPGARWRVGALVAAALPALALPALALRAQPARPATQPPARITVIGPGPTNSLTDVPGLKVGHFTRSDSGYRSGTTVIRTEKGATAGYSQMGGAPGTKETDLLKPGGQVRAVQAIMLGGGSAFGLDAATGVMQWMEEHNFGVPVGGGVVPIVPAAILMDLGRGGNFKKRPDASFGYKATEAATTAPVRSGRIGVGMGAGWGMGTASVKLSNGYTVAAIVGLNPAGSPLDPRTCLPYGYFLELGDEFNLVQPKAEECTPAAVGRGGPNDGSDNAPRNTTIALVATDAPLLDLEAERMAQIANAGLARSIRPIHGIGDGDTVFGMATTPPTSMSNADLQAIFNAGADVLGRAVVHAVLQSKQVGNSRVGYCQQYPSACVKRAGAGK
ncbi:MAG: P1 family peptidase [Gemmatimonadota bacterium]|nr:P1 family peptidase [Gemmatimonadota bacterium]